MKVFLSADMEGVAGVVDWDQCRVGGAGYDVGCRLLLGEVNAAIDGAFAAGATSVTVTDAHGLMANLAPDGLQALPPVSIFAKPFRGSHDSPSGDSICVSHRH